MTERRIEGVQVGHGSTIMLPLVKKPIEKEHIIYYEGGDIYTDIHTEGVIMRTPAQLCHMAIHCMERNIPCVGGISLNMKIVKEAQIAYGIVFVKERRKK